jgi:tetratricopeptide (TPR) repeat protein
MTLAARMALVALVCSIAAAAQADPSEKQRAAAAYKAGMAHYQLEEYDAAIEKFQEGFRLEPQPEFLYNIALCYRQSKRPDKALSYFQKFLRMRPNAPNRADVEQQIENMQAAIAAQKNPPPPPPPPPTPSTTPSTTTTPTENALVATAPPKKKPVYQRGWFWGVVAGGAVVVVGAVVLGVELSRSDNAKTLPPLSFP